MAEPTYRTFSASLMPTVDAACVLGVRVPRLRTLARQLSAAEQAALLADLPHRYHEENLLHALLINRCPTYGKAKEELERFLPFVDNWAVCDSLRPKCRPTEYPALVADCSRWMRNSHPYTVRLGIELLMLHGLGEHFESSYHAQVAAVQSNDYYVQMMVAWYFATALALQYEATLPYLEEHRLAPWIHNKTIQKARESYRVTGAHKTYLATLTRKT